MVCCVNQYAHVPFVFLCDSLVIAYSCNFAVDLLFNV